MPKVLPHPIKTDSIAVYGRMIGIRKMRYAIPELVMVEVLPADLGLTAQILIAHSSTFSETLSKVEGILLGAGKTQDDSLTRAEAAVQGVGKTQDDSLNRAEAAVITN